MHVKMFDLPDSVSTRDLLSCFADDKFNNRRQILKDRISLLVTEEERESSGMTGLLVLWVFFIFFIINI